jgi:hypothetical protein
MIRDRQEHRGRARRVEAAFALAAVMIAMGLSACGEPEQPVVLDGFVDATFSNADVAGGCLSEVIRGAEVAARSRGAFTLHIFDGDPLGRRGISAEFAEADVPRSIKGTSKVGDYLAEQAENLRPEARRLIETAPEVDGTPLLEVLARAQRELPDPKADIDHHILICTDGLFTDIGADPQAAAELSEAQGLRLHGSTVDFVGLALSAPGTGDMVEELRPAVEALLEAAGAELGVWDAELPARWP